MKPIILEKYKDLTSANFDRSILYDILLEESFRWSQNLHKWFVDRGICNIYEEIYGNIIHSKTSPSVSKLMYDYCNGISYCKICNKECKFFTFAEGYCETCGDEGCYNKLNSILRMGDNNPSHKMSSQTRLNAAKKQSIKIKKLILDGKFTPCITNSWANSRCKIKLNDSNYLFRSTWEAMFWLLNKFEYEKIRIPYIGIDKNSHAYIVDFVDEKTKTLYEIKPSKLIETSTNIIKLKAAEKWCLDNGYSMKIITEKYFTENKDTIIKLTNNKKILKALRHL